MAIIHKSGRNARSLPSLLSTAFAAVFLAACSSTPDQGAGGIDLSQPLDQSATYYLQQAEQSKPPVSYQWQLLASKRYLVDGQLRQAELLCQQLDGAFSQPTNQAHWAVHCGSTAWANQDSKRALSRLSTLPDDQYPTEQRVAMYRLRADIFITLDAHLDAAEALSKASDLVSPSAQDALHSELWQEMQKLPDYVLQPYLETRAKDNFSLWLQLAAITRASAQDPLQLMAAISQWQNDHPGHPAATNLPSNLQLALDTEPYDVRQIAVLLPLSGRYQSQGQAIRDGLLRAYFADQRPEKPTLKLYDTATNPLDAYQQALIDGAGFIIGPLTKPAISSILAEQDSSVPWLALNNVDIQLPPATDRFFFALDPETEAEQAALQMWQAGIRHPLVIAPRNSWGNRMLATIGTEWRERGGELAGSGQYTNRKELPKLLGQLMDTDASKQRSRQLESLLGVDLKTEPRNRQDVDAVYVLADAQDARLIRPYIDANLSSFSSYPVLFASSRSYQPGQRNDDLNQVYIADIPLLLEQDSEAQIVRDELETLWPNHSASLQRLYAMGHDAYTLHAQLRVMQLFPGYGIAGLSGVLNVNQRGEVERQLTWGQIQGGTLKQVPEIAEVSK